VDTDALQSATMILLGRFQCSDRHMITDMDESLMLASCIRQIVCRAGERITQKSLWAQILTCAYIGSLYGVLDAADGEAVDSEGGSDPITCEVRVQWQQAWAEGLISSTVGTKASALQLILPLVVEQLSIMIEDLSWKRRQHGISVVNDLAKSLTPAQLTPNVGTLVYSLFSVINPQIWTGQGEALLAAASLLSRCPGRCTLDGLPKDGGNPSVLLGLCQPVVSSELNDCHNLVWKPVITLSQTDQSFMIGCIDEGEFSPRGCDRTIKQSSDKSGKDDSFQARYIAFSSWAVNPICWASLLVREIGRGDHRYRLAAAKALVQLSWRGTDALNAEQDRLVIVSVVVPLLHLAGITQTCLVSLLDKFEKYTQDAAALVTTQVKLAAAPGVSSVAPAKAAISVKPNAALKVGPLKQSFDVFGSRYGGNLVSNKQNGVTKPVSRKPVSVGPSNAVTAQNPLLDMSIMHDKGDVLGELFEIVCSNVAGKAEPALRMHIIECLCGVWPVFHKDCFLELFQVSHSALVLWCLASIRKDVWSLKKSALYFLAELLSAQPVLSSDDIFSRQVTILMLETIRECYKESKYVKVRVAALTCAHKMLLRPEWTTHVKSNLKYCEVIEDIVNSSNSSSMIGGVHVTTNVAGASETDLSVAEAMSKLRAAWGTSVC
jgi:hypothetical protein